MSEDGRLEESAAREVIAAWRRDHEEFAKHTRAVTDALQARDDTRCCEAFDRLKELVSEHLRVEEELVFPLAEKRVPEAAQPIRSMRIAHVGYRQDLALIESQIRRGQLDAAGAVFAAFLESFETHERLEEQFLALLR
jgi:iron-sulfur cluster repair protein YtfE (RIC family)